MLLLVSQAQQNDQSPVQFCPRREGEFYEGGGAACGKGVLHLCSFIWIPAFAGMTV
jgi:hypothetical protein